MMIAPRIGGSVKLVIYPGSCLLEILSLLKYHIGEEYDMCYVDTC